MTSQSGICLWSYQPIRIVVILALPIIFYPFYAYLLSARKKSQPACDDLRILSRGPKWSPNDTRTTWYFLFTRAPQITFRHLYSSTLCNFSLINPCYTQVTYTMNRSAQILKQSLELLLFSAFRTWKWQVKTLIDDDRIIIIWENEIRRRSTCDLLSKIMTY